MQVIEIEPTVPVNPYAKDIEALAKQTEKNPKAAGEFVVPTEDAGKARLKISKAANAINLTASKVIDEDLADGNTRLVFKLKPRMRVTTRKRGNTTETAEETTGE